MPRYYFHLLGVVDEEGSDFPDHEAARQEAIQIARELARSGAAGAERVLVMNENGVVVHEEPI